MRGNIAKVSEHVLADDGRFPNSLLPLMVYREVVTEEPVSPEAFEGLFDANGWPSQWRDTVYDYDHYHSTAHEAMGVAVGEGTIVFGGPRGLSLRLVAGDVVVIPAGVAHRLAAHSDDFLVVGAYPPGEKWDVLRGEDGERPQADDTIAACLFQGRTPWRDRTARF